MEANFFVQSLIVDFIIHSNMLQGLPTTRVVPSFNETQQISGIAYINFDYYAITVSNSFK